MKRTTIAAMLLAVSVPVLARTNFVTYQTGNSYLHQPIESRASYVGGVFDALVLDSYETNNGALADELQDCASGVSGAQLVAAVDKTIRDDPAHWDWNASGLVQATLINFCLARGHRLSHFPQGK